MDVFSGETLVRITLLVRNVRAAVVYSEPERSIIIIYSREEK